MLTGLQKETTQPLSCFPTKDALEELERVLASPLFKATPRRKRLLRYLVEETLAGRGRDLKGYTIATLVFDREDSFDPQTDPVVRLEARRLRHDLDSYYVAGGSDNPLRISIPKGQYAPVIEQVRAYVEPSHVQIPLDYAATMLPVVDEAQSNGDRKNPNAFQRGLVVALACIALLLGVVVYALVNPGAEPAGQDAEGTSLSVLPFATNEGDPKSALLADGMANEIMTGISGFGGVHLYMASDKENGISSGDPVAIGRSLGLSYVVNGGLDLDDKAEKLRVSARLIDVATQRIVWIGSYDRDYSASSLRAVQQDIANSIATALGQPQSRE